MNNQKNYDMNKLYCFVCKKEDIEKEERTMFHPDFNMEVNLCSKKCFKILNNSLFGKEEVEK